MTTIELFAKDEVLELVTSPTVSSGDVNAVDMHIKFSEEWQGYAKVAVFFRDMDNLQEPLEQLLQDGICKVPGEVIKDHVPFYIGVRGAKNDSLKTTDIVKYSVIKGVPAIIKAPNLDIYQQILAGYANLENIKKEVAENAEQTATDRKEVERLVDSVKDIDERVEEVKTYKEQAQTSATNALLSEQESKKAEQSALQAQMGAKTAENSAGQHALEVARDKAEVERLSTQVREDKTTVERTAQGFTLKAQQTLTDVNNAGQTQTEQVQSAGTTAVENIQTAQGTTIKAVETAKTEAVKTVQAEGTKQVQAVQEVTQEIVADREQIVKNKTDIAELRQTKANAIVENASGTLINIKDSAEEKLQELRIFGKSTQDGEPTPEAPQEIKSIGKYNSDTQKYEVNVSVMGKNLIPFPYPLLGGAGTTKTVKGITVTVQDDGGIKLVGTSTEAVYFNMCEIDFGESFIGDTNGTYCIKDAKYDKRWKTTFIGSDSAGETINKVFYPQVEYGTKPTEYEPYREQQTVTLNLEEPLAKWDKLEKRDDVWGIARNGRIKTFKGALEEKWEVYSDEKNTFSIFVDEIVKEGLCSHYKSIYNTDIGKKTGIYLLFTSKIIVTNKDINTLEEWKEWLKANPITVNYKAEEKWEPLSEEIQKALNSLHSNYPTTIISNNENAEMEVTYVADTKNYIDNKLKELVTANMQNTANLLSLMPIETQATMIENDTNRILEEVTQ